MRKETGAVIQSTTQDGVEYFYVADNSGAPMSFGYRTREEAEHVQVLIDTSAGKATIPLGERINLPPGSGPAS